MGFALSPMKILSNSFTDRGPIPTRFTMEGENASPHLSWADAPEGTQSFAVICHDPDAPLISAGNYGFVHWVLYDVPVTITELAENTTIGTQGMNNFGKPGYGGPMPPSGHGTHHYFFMVLALKNKPDLKPGLTMWQLLEAIEPDVIGVNRLMGTYQR